MEMVFNAAIGLILLVFLIGGGSISNESVAADLFGARGVPMLFAAVGLVLLVLSLFVERRSASKAEAGEAASAPGGLRKMIAIVAVLLAYILCVQFVGFALGTFVLAFLSVRVIGFRSAGKNAAFSFLLTALLVVIFGRIFFIALPRGVWLMREISYFLY